MRADAARDAAEGAAAAALCASITAAGGRAQVHATNRDVLVGAVQELHIVVSSSAHCKSAVRRPATWRAWARHLASEPLRRDADSRVCSALYI